METPLLLIFTLLPLLFFLAVLRRNRRRGHPSPIPPAIEVRDPAVARCMLIDHIYADAFSNRPLSPFPVDFDAGRPVSHTINTVPYGPLWRVLRCNLTADVLHPSRLGLLAPLQREAVEALIADLSAHGQQVVVVHDSLRPAVFTVVTRMCFSDGVHARDVRAMQDALQEFFLSFAEANALAASRLSRFLHWRRWLRFAGTFDRLIELFHPLIESKRRLTNVAMVVVIEGLGSIFREVR
ncbi:hypothetical protein BAE44_0018735 [Dichanthelium oligosanthes]|uniref:Cytochrome P450 n=1 Tax=Dichanthelium oligosanthes TaxID=888268 RepID=A0A1E5V503_9POAL|nr:hypothetical protein BAE44_0018735 [Dichanthelium oligosanthes]